MYNCPPIGPKPWRTTDVGYPVIAKSQNIPKSPYAFSFKSGILAQ